MKLQISSPFRHHLFLDGADTARSPATYPACVWHTLLMRFKIIAPRVSPLTHRCLGDRFRDATRRVIARD